MRVLGFRWQQGRSNQLKQLSIISNSNDIYKCAFITNLAVFLRTMVELITNIKVKLSPLMELENDIFEEIELKC